jgi:hypothetical protein
MCSKAEHTQKHATSCVSYELRAVSLEAFGAKVNNRPMRRKQKFRAASRKFKETKPMRLNSILTRTNGAALTAVAALCIFFAGSAKADCSQLAKPRAIATFADFADGSVHAAAKPLAHTVGDAEMEAKPAGANSIVGLWMSTFLSQGQIVDQGFDMWTSDGLEVLNDTPPPATGNVCLGTWVRVAPNTYLLKHPSWTFDAAGNLNGTAIIRETITVDPSGHTYKGTFTVDVLSLSGNPLQHFAGTITGTRITVD